MARHFFIPYSVDEFHLFYAYPVGYFTPAAVRERLGWTDSTKGIGKLLNRITTELVPAYVASYQQYKSLLGTASQHAAHENLMHKQEELGDAYAQLRDALNANPDHTIEDNDGSGLPAESEDNTHTPAPIMTDSYPTIDNIVKQLAINTEMTFHDSSDDEKKHKKPDGQGRAEIVGTYTDSKDPVPTQAEVLASGIVFSATRSPFHINHGADKAGMRFSWITRWVNTRNQAGMISDVRSVILG